MNTLFLRIGTIVVSEKYDVGFYLSEKKVLGLDKNGELFIAENDVFNINFAFFTENRSVACFEQMLHALDYKGLFKTQFEMLNFIFNSTKITSMNELITFMQEEYDAHCLKINTQTASLDNYNENYNEKWR